jgi:hypothetical protein
MHHKTNAASELLLKSTVFLAIIQLKQFIILPHKKLSVILKFSFLNRIFLEYSMFQMRLNFSFSKRCKSGHYN